MRSKDTQNGLRLCPGSRYTCMRHCLVVSLRANFLGIQKPFIAEIGIVLQRWYRQSMGHRYPPSGVYFGWPHRECKRGTMGRWGARRQGRPLHSLVGSHSPHLGRVWGVFVPSLYYGVERLRSKHLQGKILHTLKDHAHWVTTLSLNTDFVLRTGPFDHTGKRPTSDEDGSFVCIRRSYDEVANLLLSSSIPCFRAV